MAHYAFLNSENIVVNVIVGVDEHETQTDLDGTVVGGSTEAWEQFYENQPWHSGLTCKRTSYNGNFRKQYAGIGFTYDPDADVFISSNKRLGWVLDDNYDWQPPHPKPNDGKKYMWMSEIMDWVELPFIEQLDDAGNNP